MDISSNIYDLQYLTNPNLMFKLSDEKKSKISPDDLKFYKRIFSNKRLSKR